MLSCNCAFNSLLETSFARSFDVALDFLFHFIFKPLPNLGNDDLKATYFAVTVITCNDLNLSQRLMTWVLSISLHLINSEIVQLLIFCPELDFFVLNILGSRPHANLYS